MEIYGLTYKYPDLNQAWSPEAFFNERYLNAVGDDTKALQKTVDDLSAAIVAKQTLLTTTQATYDAAKPTYDQRRDFYTSCSWRGGFNSNWKCSGETVKKQKWHNDETVWLDAEQIRLNGLKATIDSLPGEIASLNTQLNDATIRLNNAKEASSMANMTPAERTAYETGKINAVAQGEAAKQAALIKAQSDAQMAAASSKQKTILIIGASAILVAVIVMFFAFHKKAPMPIVK
jgi:hypothetical protein